MSAGMGTTAGDKGAPAAPQPTHIDVHIHREPLLLSCPPRPPAPQSLGCKRVLVASWVVQIALGLLSGTLGGLGCFLFYDRWTMLRTFITGICAGVVAMLAGITVFIYDKRGGTCWALLRALLAPAAFAAAITAIHIGATWVDDTYYWHMYWCDLPPRWHSTLSSSSSEETSRKELCLSYQYMIKTLYMGLQIILLSVWDLLLLTSLVPVLLFCWRGSNPRKKTRRHRWEPVTLSPASPEYSAPGAPSAPVGCASDSWEENQTLEMRPSTDPGCPQPRPCSTSCPSASRPFPAHPQHPALLHVPSEQ